MGLPATHPDEGTDAEYQVDKTQSTRFEVSIPEQNKSKTSYEVELDSEPLVAEDNWEKHEEAAASYVDLKHEIERFLDATYKAHEDTNTSLNNYEKLLTQFKTHTGKNVDKILHTLKEIENAVKEDIALNKKVLEVVEAYTKNSAGFTELLYLVKTVDLIGLKSNVESLLAEVTAQNDHLAK
ncbi:hypothetical protein Tco_1138054 [Tanacetum coccineum]